MKRTVTLLMLAALSLTATAPVLAQGATVRAQITLPSTLRLKIQTLPGFGAAPIYRSLQGDDATRFLSGNTVWQTAQGLQANQAARTQRLNASADMLRRAPQEPQVRAVLRSLQREGLREPTLTVPTARGPLRVTLQGADVGAAVVARSLGENRAATGQQIVTQLAQSQRVDPAVVANVAQAVPAARAQAAAGAVTVIDAARRLNGVRNLVAPAGVGQRLDELPGPCAPAAAGLFGRYDFPVKANLPAVKNQGARGTCWAFATVGLAETVIRRDLNARVDLSEEDYVAYSKLQYGHPTDGDGNDTSWVMQQNAAAGYYFALENAWEYNQSLKRTATETPKASGKFVYATSCTDYPFQNQCEDSVSQAETGCVLAEGKTVCGAQLPASRTPYRLDTTTMKDFWNASEPDGSLGWTVLALALGQPVMLMHDARYLRDGAGGYVPDLPYGAVQHEEPADSGKFVPNDADDRHNWNHIALLVGYISNDKLAQTVPGAPAGAGGGYFILRNSWSSCWGDGGYVYLPWNWMKKYTGALYIGAAIRKD